MNIFKATADFEQWLAKRLLYDMGWETANMHFGSPKAIPSVKRDLASRRGKWLHKASKAMFKATLKAALAEEMHLYHSFASHRRFR